MDYQTVLKFWFEQLKPAQWWRKDEELDAQITEKFAPVHGAANNGELFTWRVSAEGRLAEIIVLDQFSRNMYRNQGESFASDALALVLAQEMVSLGLDVELPDSQRAFVYMPFMHSESSLIHQQAMLLFDRLEDKRNLHFEVRHKDIIEQFGRYPHRNNLLNRLSTEAELEFLQQPGSSF